MNSVGDNRHYVLLLNSFNKLAEEFFTDMTRSFPREPKVKGYQIAFRAAKKYNNRKPVEMFMENLEPFGIQIINRDEAFFTKSEYVNHVQNLSGKMGLVQYWEDMKPENKNAIWEYMQSLYMLGMNVTGKSEELKTIMNNVNKN